MHVHGHDACPPTHTPAHTPAHTCTHLHTPVQTHTHTYTHTHMHTHTHTLTVSSSQSPIVVDYSVEVIHRGRMVGVDHILAQVQVTVRRDTKYTLK